METCETYMLAALSLAEEAKARGEVPVGCVIVDAGGRIIGRGSNSREADRNATSHAEMLAIAAACKQKGDWRLDGCALYVTLEPCAMCAGAIMNARISDVVYGAKDLAAGACGGVLNLFMERFPHRPRLVGGICEGACARLLMEFFRAIR